MNNKSSFTKEDVQALADASNELCAAIEVATVGLPNSVKDLSWERLLKQKSAVWEMLAKFGY